MSKREKDSQKIKNGGAYSRLLKQMDLIGCLFVNAMTSWFLSNRNMAGMAGLDLFSLSKRDVSETTLLRCMGWLRLVGMKWVWK